MFVLLLCLLMCSGGVFSSCRGKCKDKHAVYVMFPDPCPLTCAEPFPNPRCTNRSVRFGCECARGYILSEIGGKCIRPADCPEPICEDGLCYVADQMCCVKTCANRLAPTETMGACRPFTGCICKGDTVRLYANGTGPCVRGRTCPRDRRCNGDIHAVYKPCPNPCPLTCAEPNPRFCRRLCLRYGCECAPGYVLSALGERCVLLEDCPRPTCPMNAQYVINDENCIKTCANRLVAGTPEVCAPYTGCVCNAGYVRKYDNGTGPCIPLRECPPIPRRCGINEVRTSCAIICPPQSCESVYTSYECIPQDCEPGCNCRDEYLRDPDGVCIPSEDCPEQCNDPNASPQNCPSSCQPTCEDPEPSGICTDDCLASGCVCDSGYILAEEGGECIMYEDCPGGIPQCPTNKTFEDCHMNCPADYCPIEDNPEIVGCDPPYPCPGGCGCNNGYFLISNEQPQCVLLSECPPLDCTRPNEIWDPAPLNCNLEYCENIGGECTDQSTGPPKCVCIPGYYRNQNGFCIPASDCNLECNGDINASPEECPSSCPPTCAQPDTSMLPCVTACNPSGCVCNPGYILSEIGGICVLPEDCPDCNGDPNAVFEECPYACPITCEEPDDTGTACIQACDPPGCVCRPGYIPTIKGGPCVLPENCPGGIPQCPTNKTFVNCHVNCPTDYCPVDDSTDIIVCDPTYPCPGGCACSNGYLLLSNEEPQCILSSECPPVECTRPNEIWDPAPLNCNLENCVNIGSECIDQSTGPPKCVCIPGYYRNQNGFCIPASDCDLECNGDINASPDDCPSSCPPTCAQPDTSMLQCVAECDPSGCVCNPGYILSEIGGICVMPEDCPDCNGDPNAVFDECPYACPITCEEPDDTGITCVEACDPPGCVCRPGYIPTIEGGPCVLPENCPGGTPSCGANKTFVSCKINCPTNYCPQSDSLAIVACSIPFPCNPGCVCSPNYLLLSYDEPICILASECPPVECTRLNEVWEPSPTTCLFERCEERDLLCENPYPISPRCICEPGYYRDEMNDCIPEPECP